MMHNTYKLYRQMRAIAKTQLAQTGGVVFRDGDTITTYPTLSDAVAQIGPQILRAAHYSRPNVDQTLLYVTGSNTERDAQFYDLESFEFRQKSGKRTRLQQVIPLTPISTIEEDLTTLLDMTSRRQRAPTVHYGTNNSTCERGWLERYDAPVAPTDVTTLPKAKNAREGIERLFHEPTKSDN